jgi:hypothetical protein
MPRRVEGDIKVRCTHPGCTEAAYLNYTSRERVRELMALRDAWRCTDHDGSRVRVTPDSPSVELVLVSAERFHELPRVRPGPLPPPKLTGIYFGLPGCAPTLGRVSGPGWFLDANDFPAGSRLVVSVQVLPPEPSEVPDGRS